MNTDINVQRISVEYALVAPGSRYHSASLCVAAAGFEKSVGLELFLSNLGRGLG